MRYPDNAVPLIVFGRQRAGTRFLVGALNKFPEICIQGELPNPVMQNVRQFVDATESWYSANAAKGDKHDRKKYQHWLDKKEQLIFSLWATAGQSPMKKPHKHCRYFGYKRPNNEFYFSFYEAHLTKRKPVYVYCIRNFVDNYLSIVSRWPDRSISQVARDYLGSIAQYRKIRDAAGDRLLTFVLDEYKTKRVDYLKRNVIDRLDVDMRPEILDVIASMAPKNTTEGLGVPRRTAITRSEERYIAKNPRLQSEFEDFLE